MIMVIEKGSGAYSIDFRDHQARNKMAFFLAPGQAHQWNFSADTYAYELMFSQRFLPSNHKRFPFFNLSSTPYLDLDDEQYQDLLNELVQMNKESLKTKDLYIDLLQSRLQVVLLLLKRWYTEAFEDQEFTTDNRMINNFLSLLEDHYTTQTSTDFYADQLSITVNYLDLVCRKKSGISAEEHIKERILLEAKRKLTLTTAEIKDIAHDLGFNDPSQFSRFFRKHTDTTPNEFRKTGK